MGTIHHLAFWILVICYHTWSVPLSKFYPYGVSEGDTALPSNDDGNSGVIPISIPFPYFDRKHNSLYVNTNGVVSFLVAVSEFTALPFPLGDDRRLISPFWGDVDTRNGGTVSYRESTDPVLLQRATEDVRRAFLDQQKFSATWIFIATWDRVAFYGARGISQSKVNTFQAVLVTNGRHSFAIFNYNLIVWTTGTASGGNAEGLGGTPAQGGFNAGDGIRFFAIPGSRTNEILQLPSTSNVARAGRWMFRTDEASVEAGGYSSKVSECNSYNTLTEADRKVTYSGGYTYECDIGLTGWYRFEGAAGTKMATSPPGENKCGTSATGWLNGTHPTVAEGQVTRQVCYHFLTNTCVYPNNIDVRNCGYFFVYNLRKPQACIYRYCGSSVYAQHIDG